MDAPTTAANPTERQWYIRVDAQVYGAFNDETLWSYMREGRVTPQSFVSQSASGEFRQIVTLPGLLAWFGHLPDAVEPELDAVSQAVVTAKNGVQLIMAEIRSGRSMAFLKVLQTLGRVQRIGDTTWLVSTSHSPTDLHNVLTPPLGPEDRLFVVDVTKADSAGFNLGQSVDQSLSALMGKN